MGSSNESFAERLQAALDLHMAGRIDEAEPIYSALAAEDPNNPDVLYPLGLMCYQLGKYDLALNFLDGAIQARPSSIDTHYLAGLCATELGQLSYAISFFEYVLSLDPEFLDGMIGLGRAHFLKKNFDAAEVLFRRALELREDSPEAHFNLGNLLAVTHSNDGEAAAHLRRTIELRPDSPEAHNALGILLQSRGDSKAAADCFLQTVALAPDSAEGYSNLGAALCDQGRHQEAIPLYGKALELFPEFASAWTNLGNAHLRLGHYPSALECYEKALALDPTSLLLQSNYGTALHKNGQLDEAESALRRVIGLDPGYVQAYTNLGGVLQDAGRLEEALGVFETARRLDPERADTLYNLGNIYLSLGQPQLAREWCLKALARRANFDEARWTLSLAQLSLGDFAEGWKNFEYRWTGCENLKNAGLRDDARLWQGEAIKGRRILLWTEQGLGDALQFVRYAPMVADLGAEVWLECPAPLAPLFATVRGVSHIIIAGVERPEYDLHCPVMGLPLRFGTTLDTIPAAIPYFAVDQGKARQWAERLSSLTGPKVGLVWSGNPRRGMVGLEAIDRRRSLPLAALAPLASLPGVHWISLQKGEAADQRATSTLPLVDFTDELSDFSDTAALVNALDLVITVDTSVAHLAGALGKQVWMFSRYDSCWRWLTERSDTPWYPTMRIFRQESSGDWGTVVEEMRLALAASDLIRPS